ncbi:MAG: large conductance mechanosensitive channel protein MscL [Planctomycetota bacterium]|nr:large conductance mechanosensitive channel protein MscL [Planctomycetota bacterium]
MGFLKEFRDFALKGNVLDLAVGVIIGGAFGNIVNSMIKDVIMPVVGIAGEVDFTNRFIPLGAKVKEAVTANPNMSLDEARKLGSVLAYGSFVTVTINFVILAFCIFLVIKAFNAARKRFEAEKPAPPPAGPSEDVLLLREIRDSLKAR